MNSQSSSHFDLSPHRVKEPPDVRDDLRPDVELLPDVGVDDEVEVSLPEPGLLVLDAEVQVGQHVQAGGQEGHLLGDDGQLALLGLARVALKSS